MKPITMKITAYVLSFAILFTSIFAACGLSASAKTATTDDNGNNIIKVLDMALNKTGISASQSTIQDFLGYMSDTVQGAYQTLEDTFNAAYDNVSDMVAAAKNNVSSSASAVPDSAKSLVNGYLDYMGKCFDTTANFKEGYTKGENFRNYLMSYVTDIDDKALVGAIGAKGSYKIGSELVGLVRQNMDAFIEEHEGYYLIRTYTYKDLNASLFASHEQYLYVYNALKSIPNDSLILYSGNYTSNVNRHEISFSNLSGFSFVMRGEKTSDRYFDVVPYDSNWESVRYNSENRSFTTSTYSGSFDYFSSFNSTISFMYMGIIIYTVPMTDGSNYYYLYKYPFTIDGRLIKIWKSLDSLKSYSVGQSNIYYSNTYSSFDSTVDNSISFTGKYYTTNEYSHTTIQNNIDNSQEINETTINNIVNNYITNNYYGTGETDPPDDNPEGENWFTQLIKGIPELLKALIDGLASIVDSIADLVASLAETVAGLLEKVFIPSEESRGALKEKLESKFSIIDTTHGEITGIQERLETMGKTAPTITFPLSKTPLADYGVGDIEISFEWFEPYRYGFHTLLSSIMWIMFFFNQYFAIKHILQATSSFSSSLNVSAFHHSDE